MVGVSLRSVMIICFLVLNVISNKSSPINWALLRFDEDKSLGRATAIGTVTVLLCSFTLYKIALEPVSESERALSITNTSLGAFGLAQCIP